MNHRATLAPDLAAAIAQAGVDPTVESRPLQDALRAAIATRRGYCDWPVDHTGWVVARCHSNGLPLARYYPRSHVRDG